MPSLPSSGVGQANNTAINELGLKMAAASKATKIPKLVYGTAWKGDTTRTLVKQALRAGFRGIDTAAQPKHYQEDLVGQGIRDAINDGIVKREDLYVSCLTTTPPTLCTLCTLCTEWN